MSRYRNLDTVYVRASFMLKFGVTFKDRRAVKGPLEEAQQGQVVT